MILSFLNILSLLPLVTQRLYFCLHTSSCFLTLGDAFHFGPFSLITADGTAESEAVCMTVVRSVNLCSVDFVSVCLYFTSSLSRVCT